LAKHSPDWLARLTVTGRANRVERRFWQAGGGYDRNLMEPTTIRHVIDYIHGNPIRRGLVNQADDWPWSSAGFYSGRQPVKLDIDTTLTTALGV
jgi:putative transposase